MSDTLRELCETLIGDLQEALDGWAAYATDYFQQKHDLAGDLKAIDERITRARAELAETPAPVVSDAGLHGKYIIHRGRDGSPIDFPAFVLRLDGKDPAAIAAIRTYAGDPACPPELAADLAQSCGTPAPVVAEPFVVRHYTANAHPEIKGNGFDGLVLGENREEAEEFIAWINARMCTTPAPVPVPVSERLPGQEDRNKNGECWWFNRAGVAEWQLSSGGPYGDFWLPAHALPLPEVTP